MKELKKKKKATKRILVTFSSDNEEMFLWNGATPWPYPS